jgi:ABC-type glycerol-3-phosphate transport system substrate-binding protein
MVKKNEWPWDVLFLDRERYKYVGQNLKDPNWGEKYLVNFADQQWFTAAHKKDFLTSLNLSESYGGILPGPVLEGISYVLFVSTSVEKKLGIKVKDLDMNFSDFTEYARKVYEYNTTHSDKITFFSTQMGNAPLLMFSQVVLSIYGKAEGGDRKDALASLDKAYKIMESIAAYKPLDQFNSIAGLGYDKAQRLLFDKNCLFDLQPTWIYLLWLKSNPSGTLQMRPCELPSADQCRSPFYPGFFQVIFVVPKNCNNPKEAEKFIKFISSGEIADKWIKYSRCPTGLKNNISYTEFGQDLFNIYFRHIQNKYGNNQVETDLSGFLFKSEKKINFSENNILSGSMTAEACMKEVLRQLK